MKGIKRTVLLVCLSLLTACGVPVPEDKQDYIGYWQAEITDEHSVKQISFSISAEGQLGYHFVKVTEKDGMRYKNSFNFDMPIKEYTDTDITAGIWNFDKTFKIDKPPFEQDGNLYIIVNGYQLKRQGKLHLKNIPKTTI